MDMANDMASMLVGAQYSLVLSMQRPDVGVGSQGHVIHVLHSIRTRMPAERVSH